MIDFKYVSNKMLILTVVYFLAIIISSIIQAANGFSNSLFDYVSHFMGGGSAGIIPLILGVLPILAIIIPLLMDKIENDMVLLRIKRKRKLLYNHFIFSICISAVFTIMMACSGILASFFLTGYVTNLWGTKEGMVYYFLENKAHFQFYIPHVTSINVWTYILSSRFLAILFIAACVIFLKLILKKNMYVFFAALIILGTEGPFSGRYSLFLGRARIKLETWVTPEDQWFNLVYFVFGIVLLYYICLKIYDKKEFYD